MANLALNIELVIRAERLSFWTRRTGHVLASDWLIECGLINSGIEWVYVIACACSKCETIPLYNLLLRQVRQVIERMHVTSQSPYWCP